jgi:predicted amidohydrolase YtcJ
VNIMGRSFVASVAIWFALLTISSTAQAALADGLAPLPADARPYHYKLAVSIDAPGSRYTMRAVLGFAIGDRANDWLLDTYEKIESKEGARDQRFRIEHAQHLTPAAIARFKPLNVIASMQPYHAIDDGRWAQKRIGAKRLRGTYAFRSLLDAGAHLTFGSDWPVAPIDPLVGIYAATTRRTIDDANPGGWQPQEKITVKQALRAYTSENAYAGRQETSVGILAPGYLADFAVLSSDLFEIDPVQIRDVQVLRTVIGGRDAFVKGR